MKVKLKSLPYVLIVALGSSVAMGEALFDGKTLAGWQTSGDARWSMEQGAIAAHGTGDGYLASDEMFADFDLSLEFWVDGTTNSGVFIRCRDRDNIHPETCYELNIWDDHPRQDARTGSIVFKVMPPLAKVETVGRWNTLNVVAEGASLTVTINDQVTAVLEQAIEAPGFIALQHFGEGTVIFRNVQLQAVRKDRN